MFSGLLNRFSYFVHAICSNDGTIHYTNFTEAEKYPNIHLNFNKKLISAKLHQRCLTFQEYVVFFSVQSIGVIYILFLIFCSQQFNAIQEETADLIIGCDGAFSSVRRHMLQTPGFNFSQTYIDHGYIELCIPALNGEVTNERPKF